MIAAALMLAPIVPLAAPEKPIDTTIAAILANPAKFDGHVVRLHGYVNRCSSLDCAISERSVDTVGGIGALLCIAADPKFDAVVAPLAPTAGADDRQPAFRHQPRTS